MGGSGSGRPASIKASEPTDGQRTLMEMFNPTRAGLGSSRQRSDQMQQLLLNDRAEAVPVLQPLPRETVYEEHDGAECPD